MMEYQAIKQNLYALHEAASIYGGWDKEQASTFIRVGEYGLALDSIAYAYLSNDALMPPDIYAIFEQLADTMKLDDDPEFEGVAHLKRKQMLSP